MRAAVSAGAVRQAGRGGRTRAFFAAPIGGVGGIVAGGAVGVVARMEQAPFGPFLFRRSVWHRNCVLEVRIKM